MTQIGRRSILKSIGVSVSGVGVLSSKGKANPGNVDPQIIKGDAKNPVKKSEITRAREAVFDEFATSANTPSAVAVSGNPEPENGKLVGYGLAIENGVPVERKKTIRNKLQKGTSRGSPKFKQPRAFQNDLPAEVNPKTIQDRVDAAHNDLDRFRQQFKGGE